jgi:uncharacterized delta-60 repeat protein
MRVVGSHRLRQPQRTAVSACIATAVEGLERRLLFAVAGDLDPTFGAGGRVLTDFPASSIDATWSTALQSHGGIVTLSGGVGNGTRLSRYTADGVLDTTFGAGGSTTVPFPVATLAVRADNRIVLAGAADANSVRIARYTAGGQVDTTFGGGDGEVVQPYFGGPLSTVKSISKLLIEPNSNRIYLAGTALRDTYDFALAAFNEDGSRYDFFGNDGQYNTFADFGHVDLLNDAALAPNGDIVAVGSWTVSDSHHPYYAGDYAVVRWDQSGIPVSSFGGTGTGTGRTTVQFGVGQDPDSLFDTAQSVTFDAAGNIVVAGRSYDAENDGPFVTSVARLTPGGALDATFSPGGAEGDGRALLSLTDNSFDTVNTVAVLPAGKILIGSAVPGGSGADFALARLTSTGALDTTFGVAGKVTTDFGADDRPRTLLIQSGKAVLAGGSTLPTANPGDAQSRLAMARYGLDNAPPPQAPFGGTPISLAGTLQFENFDEGGEGVAYHDTDAANIGGAYRATGVDVQAIPAGGFNVGFAKAGEWVEYTVSVPQDGSYDVDVRLASLKGGGKFRFEVDGAAVGALVTAPNTGGWEKYATVRVNAVPLTSGTHVLRLVMAGNDSTGYVANFDSARFTRRNAMVQTPFGGKAVTTPGRIELENFDDGGEGVAYHDTDAVNQAGAYRNTGVDVEAIPAASGGGFNLGYAKAGEWTEYTFVVPPDQAGAYDLHLRYAAPRAGEVEVEIDGDVVGGVPVTLRNTASWQTYDDAYPAFNYELSAGTHVLRLNQVKNGAYGYVANYDYLEFTRYRDPYYYTPFNPGETIQAEDFDRGGEGVTYHDAEASNLGAAPYRAAEGVDIEPATDAGGGYNVGYTKAGEWLEYAITNPTGADAFVGLDVRLASLRAGGRFHFEVDGKTVAGFTAPATGSWQTYTTLGTAKNIRLTPGHHTLRLVMDQNNSIGYVANFNWMKLVG